ncbi:MAG: pyridoxamine 5'-phosphate oxidase [endosymbiont of Galathealinum brachiosum]|uniref:Pyridoxamine 5'-phosphate oxidase n=1 Tax=endosymbiont of Galathealinum brachiosum TaxID=2200906 RepID=A0A370D949_9GAMM|nr:MAG: pyridoxamine 5'-phosphate oxidase [endosymbiont of Galathealinum brachiosum]
MSDKFEKLTEKHIQFIKNQHMYFIGTAAPEGYINVSPKGMDSFRVINENKVIWLNLTGSGNESAAHVVESPRMTIMFCSFDKQPLIMRLYGRAGVLHERDERWDELYSLFPDSVGARQIFELELDLIQTSCGFAVPFYEFKGERPTLSKWIDSRGKEGINDYWEEKNTLSLNGKDTHIF